MMDDFVSTSPVCIAINTATFASGIFEWKVQQTFKKISKPKYNTVTVTETVTASPKSPV